MDQVLNTANDRPIRDQGAQLLGQLGNLGYEGTVATHTMWVTVIRQRKVSPQPDLPEPPKHLKEDFKSQFSKLTTDLRGLFRELLLHHSALRVHLEQRNRHSATAEHEDETANGDRTGYRDEARRIAANIAKLPGLLKCRSPQCGFFRCTTLPDCPDGFSGSLSQAIHPIISARVSNKLASFCPQFSQVRLSSSSVYNSIGGSGSFSSSLSN